MNSEHIRIVSVLSLGNTQFIKPTFFLLIYQPRRGGGLDQHEVENKRFHIKIKSVQLGRKKRKFNFRIKVFGIYCQKYRLPTFHKRGP